VLLPFARHYGCVEMMLFLIKAIYKLICRYSSEEFIGVVFRTLLQKHEDDAKIMKDACRRLQVSVMQIFAHQGW
jgi:hypothetical protein